VRLCAGVKRRLEMTARNPFTIAPTLDDIAGMAQAALTSIPEALRRHVGDIPIIVEDFPDEEVERSMGLESPFDILGLYSGLDMSNKTVGAVVQDLDRIFLYRRPILDYWCETGEDLGDIVRHVVIHEIGHHFGFSDDDMEALEAQED
jgi:predicted Zn-dependent protease with MMP-like domain